MVNASKTYIPFYTLTTQALSTIKMCLSISVNVFNTVPYRHAQRLISQVILDPTKLTINTYHSSHVKCYFIVKFRIFSYKCSHEFPMELEVKNLFIYIALWMPLVSWHYSIFSEKVNNDLVKKKKSRNSLAFPQKHNLVVPLIVRYAIKKIGRICPYKICTQIFIAALFTTAKNQIQKYSVNLYQLVNGYIKCGNVVNLGKQRKTNK